MTIPGVGPLTATAMAALAPPPQTFRRGRDFAAWLGLTPRQRSTGGKQRLGATTRMGERSLRLLLIIGANSVVIKRHVHAAASLAHGWAACSRASRRCWSGWRSPTRWRGSCGR
jgi:transposase